MKQSNEEALRKALQTAFNLGQTYWQQSDSESSAQWKRSDLTRNKFTHLVEETVKALSQPTNEVSPEVVKGDEKDKRIAELEDQVKKLQTVPMKYRRMEFNAQLQNENVELMAENGHLHTELMHALSDKQHAIEPDDALEIWNEMLSAAPTPDQKKG